VGPLELRYKKDTTMLKLECMSKLENAVLSVSDPDPHGIFLLLALNLAFTNVEPDPVPEGRKSTVTND
jgi:hypothetical protein